MQCETPPGLLYGNILYSTGPVWLTKDKDPFFEKRKTTD